MPPPAPSAFGLRPRYALPARHPPGTASLALRAHPNRGPEGADQPLQATPQHPVKKRTNTAPSSAGESPASRANAAARRSEPGSRGLRLASRNRKWAQKLLEAAQGSPSTCPRSIAPFGRCAPDLARWRPGSDHYQASQAGPQEHQASQPHGAGMSRQKKPPSAHPDGGIVIDFQTGKTIKVI